MASKKVFNASETDVKIFVLATVTMSLSVWDVAFTLGAYNTVFFDKIFTVWVASTSALLASLFIPPPPGRERFLSWRGRFVLLLPTLAVLLQLAEQGTLIGDRVAALALVLGLLSAIFTLPYTIYVLILVVTPDLENMKTPRLAAAMIIIVVVVGLIGFQVGRHNRLFLTCEDFTVSGSDTPVNCHHEDKLKATLLR